MFEKNEFTKCERTWLLKQCSQLPCVGRVCTADISTEYAKGAAESASHHCQILDFFPSRTSLHFGCPVPLTDINLNGPCLLMGELAVKQEMSETIVLVCQVVNHNQDRLNFSLILSTS
jgi:hypothetical protein